MRSLTLLLAAVTAALLASPVSADPRVTSRFFREGEVVTVHGRNGLQSTIAFAADERIENVAVGDASAWQVVPNKRADLVFVRPIKPRARTNMTVVTDRHTYLFDLISTPAEPVYLLSFTYPPAPPEPVTAPEAKALAEAAPPPAMTPPPPPSPADLNFAWERHGAKQLLPERSYDDGQSTYLSWPANVPLPAILTLSATGVEGPVNYTVHGGTIVVDGVPSQIILRSGKLMATLSPAPRVATTSPPASVAAKLPVRASLPEASSVPTPIHLPAQTASSAP